MSDDYKYWAFISYSHKDKAWGDWLHKALENYRVPRRLVGQSGRDGVVPRRIYPVFRDREELPTSADLGSNIEAALAASRYLVVIASPSAAKSTWVNEEIRTFKAMGKSNRVLCLIVEGEPNCSEGQESAEQECFPSAVRFQVDAQRTITDQPAEPIAADARPEGDGRANAKTKLLAGLLGINFDDLKRREVRRKRVRLLSGCLAALTLIVSGLVVTFMFEQQTQKHQFEATIRALEVSSEQLEKGHKTLGLRLASFALERAQDLRLGRFTAWLESDLGVPLSDRAAMDRRLTHAAWALLTDAVYQHPHRVGIEQSEETPDSVPASTPSPIDSPVDLAGQFPKLPSHRGPVISLQTNASGQVALLKFADGTYRFYSPTTGEPLPIYVQSEIRNATFNPAGDHVALALEDRVEVRRLADGHVLYSLYTQAQPVIGVEYNSNGDQLLATTATSTEVWRLLDTWQDPELTTRLESWQQLAEDMLPLEIEPGRSADVTGVSNHAGTARAILRDDGVRALTLATGEEIELGQHQYPLGEIGFSKDDRLLFTSDYPDFSSSTNQLPLYIWRADSGALISTLDRHWGQLHARWLEHQNRVITRADAIRIWAPVAGELVAEFSPGSFAIDRTGTRIAIERNQQIIVAPLLPEQGTLRDYVQSLTGRKLNEEEMQQFFPSAPPLLGY